MNNNYKDFGKIQHDSFTTFKYMLYKLYKANLQQYKNRQTFVFKVGSLVLGLVYIYDTNQIGYDLNDEGRSFFYDEDVSEVIEKLIWSE
jgi:hypothetical protein